MKPLGTNGLLIEACRFILLVFNRKLRIPLTAGDIKDVKSIFQHGPTAYTNNHAYKRLEVLLGNNSSADSSQHIPVKPCSTGTTGLRRGCSPLPSDTSNQTDGSAAYAGRGLFRVRGAHERNQPTILTGSKVYLRHRS